MTVIAVRPETPVLAFEEQPRRMYLFGDCAYHNETEWRMVRDGHDKPFPLMGVKEDIACALWKMEQQGRRHEIGVIGLSVPAAFLLWAEGGLEPALWAKPRVILESILLSGEFLGQNRSICIYLRSPFKGEAAIMNCHGQLAEIAIDQFPWDL